MERKNKNLVLVLIVLVLLIAGAWVYYWYSHKKVEIAANPTHEQPKPSRTFELYSKKVPSGQLPQGFPADIPLESGANILQNVNKGLRDGRLQATREFVSNKTMEGNVAVYTDFFKKNGWKLDPNNLDTPNRKGLFASKDQTTAAIVISGEPKVAVSTVSITVIVPQNSVK